jgi:CheY-like chemotaxis protein
MAAIPMIAAVTIIGAAIARMSRVKSFIARPPTHRRRDSRNQRGFVPICHENRDGSFFQYPAKRHNLTANTTFRCRFATEPPRKNEYRRNFPWRDAGCLLACGADPAQSPAKRETEGRCNVARILLIDDNEIVRATIRRVLAVSGHTVETAVDGTDGQAKFAGGGFDVVVCDMHMPGEGGGATIRAIRSRDSRVGIIAISGSGPSDTLAMATNLGADLTLGKPFTNQDLLAAVTRAGVLRAPG